MRRVSKPRVSLWDQCWGLSAATVSRVGVICHGGLIQDGGLPYMVQSRGEKHPWLIYRRGAEALFKCCKYLTQGNMYTLQA